MAEAVYQIVATDPADVAAIDRAHAAAQRGESPQPADAAVLCRLYEQQTGRAAGSLQLRAPAPSLRFAFPNVETVERFRSVYRCLQAGEDVADSEREWFAAVIGEVSKAFERAGVALADRPRFELDFSGLVAKSPPSADPAPNPNPRRSSRQAGDAATSMADLITRLERQHRADRKALIDALSDIAEILAKPAAPKKAVVVERDNQGNLKQVEIRPTV